MTQACHRIRYSMVSQSTRCTRTYQRGTHPSEMVMVYNIVYSVIISAGRHDEHSVKKPNAEDKLENYFGIH